MRSFAGFFSRLLNWRVILLMEHLQQILLYQKLLHHLTNLRCHHLLVSLECLQKVHHSRSHIRRTTMPTGIIMPMANTGPLIVHQPQEEVSMCVDTDGVILTVDLPL